MNKTKRKRTKINIGDKFNRLTIIEFTGNQNSHRTYKALCDCGNFTKVKGTHLVQGNIKSCGCLFSELKSKEKGICSYNTSIKQYKNNAKNRKLNFDLTFDNFKYLTSLNCYYCNAKPRLYNSYLNLNGTKRDQISDKYIERAWININGIDRIDSNKGYTLPNCVPCCTQCNVMKMDKNRDNFLNQIKLIYNNLFKKEE